MTLSDTGAPASASHSADNGMVSRGVARVSLLSMSGLLLLLVGAWQPWRRESA